LLSEVNSLINYVWNKEELPDQWKELLLGKPEQWRPIGRSRHRWVDNIKMDRGEIGRAGVDWIGLAQDRDKWRALVNAVMNLCVP
jgi:hypothetical protein